MTEINIISEIEEFRLVLLKDIEEARKKLDITINEPLGEPGEIEMSPMALHASKVNASNKKLEDLKDLYRQCFPDPSLILEEAKSYLKQKKEKIH